MIVMALDHVRDFLHSGAMAGASPTNLETTTPVLFFTRWITHFCLPVFMFTAGAGIYLRGQRVMKSQLAKFLWTRGLWFILLELTVMRLAYNFSFSLRFPLLLLILWIFGLCMLAMAALIYVPGRVLAAASLGVILLHNCLDSIGATQFGSFAWIWNLLHQPGAIPFHGTLALISYPIIPWVAVMAMGYCFGQVFRMPQPQRQRILLRSGAIATAAFIVLRAINIYGDPALWSAQRAPLFSVLSFLNCTKYPASLDFLLMTLGPSLIALAFLDRYPPRLSNPLVVFGRVPLFYFILHFYAIHAVVVLMAWIRYGPASWSFALSPLPSMGGSRQLFPPDVGYSLPVVYTVWIGIVLSLYPLCSWFARFRSRRTDWWLSYL